MQHPRAQCTNARWGRGRCDLSVPHPLLPKVTFLLISAQVSGTCYLGGAYLARRAEGRRICVICAPVSGGGWLPHLFCACR